MSDYELLNLVFTVLFGLTGVIAFITSLIFNILTYIQTSTKKDYPSGKRK